MAKIKKQSTTNTKTNSFLPEGFVACPIQNTLNIMGKKYTVLIIRNMVLGKQIRFNELLRSITGITPRLLSRRLHEMEKEGLIKREIFHESPVRIENHLTEKGLALRPILKEMAKFSAMHYAKNVCKGGKIPSRFKK
ncbi:MAG: helix-turn-helix transcriptional regulator [Thaumarchaeota archaeon]|nr:helix-turn-helix transcriptional regulator [Nitrososphaerota archaeon]